MSFPAWFIETIQGRMVEVSAIIEHESEPRLAFNEEREAFRALFASMDIACKPEFENWEDKLSIKQSVIYERLYLQGLKDGMQLAQSFNAPSVLSE
ncbi:hypothetical protein MHI24_20165 [Paenibacillus sp. FSL K6-1096]|uniref:hypothetical protein n=1 Tax=Paenibacillus sp. FSL K6-1096 TaxID=2921460 RepID=UPI0030EE32F6